MFKSLLLPLLVGGLSGTGVLGPLEPARAHAAGSASCALSSTSLAFGQYVPSRNTPSDFTATLTLSCVASGDTPTPIAGTIALLGVSDSSGRTLTEGTHRLRYQLFLDPGRTLVWGDGTGDSDIQAIGGTAGPSAPFRQSFVIYGRILARQAEVGVGDYADQITAVLTY